MDFIYFFVQQKTEHLNLLKHITFTIFLRTDYVNFNNPSFTGENTLFVKQGQQKDSEGGESNKQIFHYPNNILSYCIKPLSFSNFYDKSCIFDKNFKRNPFYISKIKDISKPLLFFTSSNKVTEKSLALSSSESTVLSLQKNISSFQVNSGPRVLIKKSNSSGTAKIE